MVGGLTLNDGVDMHSMKLPIIFDCIKRGNISNAVDFARMVSNYGLEKRGSEDDKLSITSHYLGRMVALLSFAATDYSIKDTLEVLRIGYTAVIPEIQSITKAEFNRLEKARAAIEEWI